MKRTTEEAVIAQRVPLFEVLLRPGDTRPVSVVFYEGPGGATDIEVSPGTAWDMEDLLDYAGWLIPVAQVTRNLRKMREENEATEEPPF